jgi:outer membrane receptor protein involved in Fe transport
VRQGNPDLKPEYTDAFELGYQLPVRVGRLTLDAYHRITSNKIEDYNSVYAPQVILRSVANVGTDYSTGAELMLELRPARWLGLSLSGDLYDYRLTGRLPDSTEVRSHSFNWEGNTGIELRPLPDTRVQFNLRYQGPAATAQGTENGFFMSGASVRQQLFSRRLSVSLQAMDLFASSGHGETSGGPGYDFYTRFRFRRTQAPSFSLGLTWNFNNFKLDRRLMQNDVPDEGGDPQQ